MTKGINSMYTSILFIASFFNLNLYSREVYSLTSKIYHADSYLSGNLSGISRNSVLAVVG